MNTCKVCSAGSSVRHQVDSAAVSGTSLRDIAGRHSISKSAIQRHLTSHLAPEIQAAFSDRLAVNAGSLALQVLEIADDLKAATEDAKAKGSARDIARLSDSRLRAWALLSTRLGVDEEAVREHLLRAVAVWHALQRVAKEHPEIREPLIESLRANEGGDRLLSSVIEQLETKELEQ